MNAKSRPLREIILQRVVFWLAVCVVSSECFGGPAFDRAFPPGKFAFDKPPEDQRREFEQALQFLRGMTQQEKREEQPVNRQDPQEEIFELVPASACFMAGQRWTNTLNMEFVKVAGTEVLFSLWDTRVSDYRAYAEANSGVDESWKESGRSLGETSPVVSVGRNDAQAFCAWLTLKERGEGKIKADQRYRLPTDAEWSVAVGLEGEAGGTPKDKNMKIKGVYPWGTQWPPPKGAGNYDQSLEVDDYKYTSPVGSFKANQHGLYDMGGNVWQWCEDWYDGAQTSRVLRGASWVGSRPVSLLSSCRSNDDPDFRNDIIGFRCVLVGGGSL